MRVLRRLAELGYSFFHHVPKADAYLRRRWREPHPPAVLAKLAELSAHCRGLGLRFGVGLSLYELYRDDSAPARANFIAKVRALDEIGLDDLAILFDDTRGDIPDLAAREAEIVHTALDTTRASRVVMCPTYYSDDRMLDVVFGGRPADDLVDLGRRLDPRVGVYWTGEEICTREFSAGHLMRVAEALRRRPTLWDNYPVNDGPCMSRFLHLRDFTGRPSAIGSHVVAHAINPALQPHLSLIPAATLAASYREGTAYCYMNAFRVAARALAGDDLADMLERDLHALHDCGLDQLGDDREHLRQRYAAVDHPMAAEVVRWLGGADTTGHWVEDARAGCDRACARSIRPEFHQPVETIVTRLRVALTVMLAAVACLPLAAQARADKAIVNALEGCFDFIDANAGTILPERIPTEDYRRFYVLDERDAGQFAKGHIPGAVNIGPVISKPCLTVIQWRSARPTSTAKRGFAAARSRAALVSVRGSQGVRFAKAIASS